MGCSENNLKAMIFTSEKVLFFVASTPRSLKSLGGGGLWTGSPGHISRLELTNADFLMLPWKEFLENRLDSEASFSVY